MKPEKIREENQQPRIIQLNKGTSNEVDNSEGNTPIVDFEVLEKNYEEKSVEINNNNTTLMDDIHTTCLSNIGRTQTKEKKKY